MKKRLLALIRCPDCGFDLSLVNASSKNAEIISGNLLCEVCRASFPIEEGLPVILRSDRRAFGIADFSSLHDCVILDAGCGSGALTADIGKAAPSATVIGVDFSESARLAHARCRAFPN